MSNIEPWVVTSGGVNPVKLQIDEADFDEAKKQSRLFSGNNSL